MDQTDIIIGPFRRRVFAEALALLLDEEPGLSVRLIEDEDRARSFLDADTPTVVILQAPQDHEGASDHERSPPLLPRSDAVSVILISQEGEDVQIALRKVDRSRLRAAISLADKAPYPKVVALSADAPSQPPFMLPNFRRAETSGLSWVLAWLDAAFACALDDLAAARTGEGGAAWMQDLALLRNGFCRGQHIDGAEEARRFKALVDARMWQVRLFRTFALDPVELKLICLCAAPEIDHRYAQAIGLMQGNYADARPNATTLARMVGDETVGADIRALLAGRRNFARLAMIREEPGREVQPGYRVAPALFDLMLGIRRHAGAGWRLQGEGLPPQESLSARMADLLAGPAAPLVLATGEGVDLADEIAAALAANHCRALRADCRQIETETVHNRLQDWALRARLHDAALMLDGVETLDPGLQHAVLRQLDEGLARLRIVTGNTVPVSHDAVQIHVAKPTLSVLSRRWCSAAADHGLSLDDADARTLGSTLRLGLSDMDGVLRIAAGEHRTGAGYNDTAALIRDAARRVAAGHAPETVRRPVCVFGWNDIVLPPKMKAVLASVPGHVRHSRQVLDTWDFASRLPYGRGVGALFAGPSGTGKTMCAQVIAADLGVELMQVEIARCVSKYIGETEKNIDRCFRAAEAASAVLLFDEADALFGKRTEIKDAHDRHANVEVAYLLQRIEAYEGLVILTSNFKANIDPAFLRRLRFVCEFAMPTAEERHKIWRLAFPEKARCAPDVNFDFLARRLPLSGGSIQSIAVNAAYGAAADGLDAIQMRHVMDATRAELLKNGMLSAERTLPEPAAPRPLQEAVS
jgi:hypothetical protein